MGCLTQEAENFNIVIPPGDQVSFTSEDFLEFSEDEYLVLFRGVGEENHDLYDILDITPLEEKRVDPLEIHRQIIPKGTELNGTFVVEVVMDFHKTHFVSFVFGNEYVAKPNMYTTLTYKLLANYPNKKVNTFSQQEIESITAFIETFAQQRMSLFNLTTESVKLDLLFKFVQNGLSSDVEFLDFVANLGIEFNYNSEGDITSAPHPFGVVNSPPVLDPNFSTPQGVIAGQEAADITVSSPAFDPDGDLIFYIWNFEGEFHSADSSSFFWVPTYQDSRPENYQLNSLISDGGKILNSQWDIKVLDSNLFPELIVNCPQTVTENQEFRCTLEAYDINEDPITWSLANSGFDGPVSLGGQPPGTPAMGTTADLVFTPNNADAKRGSATFEVRINDGKGGTDFRLITLSVIDVNSPPQMIGGIVATNMLNNPAREWDYCLDRDVYLGNDDSIDKGPFSFSVVIQDPDNVNGAFPEDVISLRISGLGTENILPREIDPIVFDTINNQVIYHYEWKPNHDSKVANINFLISDDHGGFGDTVQIQQVAQDVNQRPCIESTGNFFGYLYKYQHFVSNQNQRAYDNDGDIPIMVATNFSRGTVGNFSLDQIPFYEYDEKPLVVRQKVDESDYSFKTQDFSLSQNYRVYAESLHAGVLTFERPTAAGSDISVPEGYTVNLIEASTGHFIEYETAVDFTIEADDVKVAVPIRAINREVTANLLSVIDTSEVGPLTDPTLVLSHSGFDTKLSNITISRGPGSPNNNVWIDENLIFRNAPGQKSMAFKPAGNFFLGAGENSVTIPIIRDRQSFPASSAINYVSLAPDITVSLGGTVHDHNGYWIRPVRNFTYFYHDIVAYDGALTEANEINVITTGSFPSHLQVNNLAQFEQEGDVVFSRPTTDSLTTLTIPANTEVRTLNDKKYRTQQSLTLLPGESSGVVRVKRTPDISPPRTNGEARYVRIMHRDWNYKPIQGSGSLSFSVQEGGEQLNFPIEVKDSSNALDPRNPDDTYTFTDIPQLIVPQGEFNYCREPVTTFTESQSCTPCSAPLSPERYHASRFCYLNFRPDILDTAESFELKVSVDEDGYSVPGGTQSSEFSLNINVLEFNEAPVMTDENGNAIIGTGDTVSNPIVINQDFIEGVPGAFNLYATDGDKSLNLKKVNFEIEEVYDASLANQVVARPTNLTVNVTDRLYDPTGIGSTSTAVVKWKPTDADIKQYGGPDGIIIKVNVYDNISIPSQQLSVTKYYKLGLRNTNNIPSFLGISDTFEPVADTYFTQTITVIDGDNSVPFGGSFETDLNLCLDNFGNEVGHDGIDEFGALSSTALDTLPLSPFHSCHVNSNLWGHKFTQFESIYEGNLSVPECRVNLSDGSNEVNQDLAVPKLTRINGPYNIGDKIAYDYRLEWCPQISQIGRASVDLLLTDNGDTNRAGDSLPFKQGSVSIQVNVISPVFFQSPNLALQDVPGSDPVVQAYLPNHFMKQTTARSGDFRFKYPLIINNSKKNPLQVVMNDSPRDCGLDNGACLVEENGQWSIDWSPKFPDDVTNDNDENTWHRFELTVTDTVTNETDNVYFLLKVHAASSNQNFPVINSASPNNSSLSMNELQPQVFTVNATDSDSFPAPELHYRWYVDGVLVDDNGPSYTYVPDKFQGGIDVDGAGPLAVGEHTLLVEVTDGNYVTSQSWNVNVKNSFLVPQPVFDFVEQRKEVDGNEVSNLSLELELPVEETFSTPSGDVSINYVLLSGAYTVGVTQKHFLWSLKFFEGSLVRDLASSNPWSLFEGLPWPSFHKTERLSYYTSSGQLSFLASAQPSRSGPYSTISDAVKMSGNFSDIATPLAGGFKCIGSCAKNLYLGTDGYGHRVTESWGNYLFFVDDTNKKVLFTYDTGSSTNTVDNFSSLALDGSDDFIYGIAANDQTGRLYITSKDINSGESYVHVYDLSPLGSNIVSSGSAVPNLVGRINLVPPAPFAGVSAGPTDIVVDPSTNSVYTFLAGVGGVLKFVDNGGALPTLSSSDYLGLGYISASPTDLASSGRKLFFDENNSILAGISREGNQIFTVNPEDGNKVSVHSYPAAFDAILNFSQTGVSMVVQRSSGRIFELK